MIPFHEVDDNCKHDFFRKFKCLQFNVGLSPRYELSIKLSELSRRYLLPKKYMLHADEKRKKKNAKYKI